MESVRDIERRDLDAALGEPFRCRFDSGGGAGDHRLLRMVQVRDHHPVDPAQRRCHFLGIGSGARHRACIGQVEIQHRQPAPRHQADRIFGAQHARGGGGRELAQAVAEGDVSAGAKLLQQDMQRESHRSHRGLAHLGLHQAPFCLGRRFRIEEAPQRTAEARVEVGDRVVEMIEPVAEGGDLLVHLSEQPDLLRALAGEEQGDLPVLERPLGEHGAGDDLPRRRNVGRRHRIRGAIAALVQLVRAGQQSLREHLERVRRDGQPRIAMRPLRQRIRDVRERASLAAQSRQCLGDQPREPGDEGGASAGEQEELRAGLARRRQAAAWLGRLPRFLEHEMGVRTAESERADARTARLAVGLPGHLRLREEEWTRAQLELGILVGDAGLGWKLAVIQGESDLDQPGDARGGHRVSDVRLHAAERRPYAVARAPARLIEQLAQGADLDHVADRSGGAVRLDVPDARGRDARVAICHPQRLELAALPRSHRAFAAAVVVRRCAPDDRVDAVAVPDRIVEALEDDRAGAFPHEESVRGCIEGTAFAGAGDGPDAAEADQVVGKQVQVYAARDREIDLAAAQVHDGLLRGHQRRRAGGVNGKRGASQVPGLRDDGRGHIEQVPGHGERSHRHHVLDERVAQPFRFRS